MRRTGILLACIMLSCSGARAQSGIWTNKAGHVLAAVPVELKGSQVVFKIGAKSAVYPLSVFLPAEQKRLKAALGLVDVPPALADSLAQTRRLVARLGVLHEGGRLSDEGYRDACAKARTAFREKAAPFVEKGLIRHQDVLQLMP